MSNEVVDKDTTFLYGACEYSCRDIILYRWNGRVDEMGELRIAAYFDWIKLLVAITNVNQN